MDRTSGDIYFVDQSVRFFLLAELLQCLTVNHLGQTIISIHARQCVETARETERTV